MIAIINSLNDASLKFSGRLSDKSEITLTTFLSGLNPSVAIMDKQQSPSSLDCGANFLICPLESCGTTLNMLLINPLNTD